MTIAKRLQKFMEEHDVEYDVVMHRPTPSSSKTAQVSHVSGHRIAKGVVLKDEDGYTLAVLPATRHVRLNALQEWLHRNFALASEEEIGEIFADCDLGAIPAMGDAYGLPTLVDETIEDAPEIYVEAGDHKCLLHMKGNTFRRLVEGANHGHFSTAA